MLRKKFEALSFLHLSSIVSCNFAMTLGNLFKLKYIINFLKNLLRLIMPSLHFCPFFKYKGNYVYTMGKSSCGNVRYFFFNSSSGSFVEALLIQREVLDAMIMCFQTTADGYSGFPLS